ncbi:release factor glutamine methyltransferase [Evansella vedderi]|uniref:Release factor glutamine methyltransferase n=1 Tax=Evansella vedderi TaxID=38282 RepID=A0ABU0A111_9BACI|nr:peptide chain release factor N(5)-glutamine methyltransferase [Evansella vedderi]MDQ0257177.1 release factor glutamine methyltransferase [Evansella vedderi]
MSGKKVYEALQWASSFLQSHDYEERIGEILLLHHTGWSRSRLFSEYQSVLDAEVWSAFQRDVTKAASGTPVQYITGVEEFYGRIFAVGPDVLIPRPETEELIETVLELASSLDAIQLVDVGTGSGIIAITLNLELPKSEVHAVDISASALQVARNNAAQLGASVTFHKGDLLEPILSSGKKFNVVVSNPPYIPEGDRSIMKGNVLDHEPELALFAGEDGLDIYRELVAQIPKVLEVPGVVAFEIGHGQGAAVKSLLQGTFPTARVEVRNDINGKERIVYAVVQ